MAPGLRPVALVLHCRLLSRGLSPGPWCLSPSGFSDTEASAVVRSLFLPVGVSRHFALSEVSQSAQPCALLPRFCNTPLPARRPLGLLVAPGLPSPLCLLPSWAPTPPRPRPRLTSPPRRSLEQGCQGRSRQRLSSVPGGPGPRRAAGASWASPRRRAGPFPAGALDGHARRSLLGCRAAASWSHPLFSWLQRG